MRLDPAPLGRFLRLVERRLERAERDLARALQQAQAAAEFHHRAEAAREAFADRRRRLERALYRDLVGRRVDAVAIEATQERARRLAAEEMRYARVAETAHAEWREAEREVARLREVWRRVRARRDAWRRLEEEARERRAATEERAEEREAEEIALARAVLAGR